MAKVARHIVVAVDDDFRDRESRESLVELAGDASLMFSSADEFLCPETLAAATGVTTNVLMPGMDGIELQRRIRLELQKLPVIFISAHDSAETRQRTLDESTVDSLFKPFDAWACWE
jgi:FixJ family two-component response regulator